MNEDLPASKRARTDSSVDSPTDVVERQRIIRLNVGGVHYEVASSLFDWTAPSMLFNMFSERWLDQRTLDSDGRVFIDRDGVSFRHVANYLRSGPGILEFLSDCELGQLRIEADFYRLEALCQAIDDVKMQKKHGCPVTLRADSWARVQGEVRSDRGNGGFKSWDWTKESGNGCVRQSPSFLPRTIKVEETGTYLILVRLFCSPQYRISSDEGYWKGDEFAAVSVLRDNTSPNPSWPSRLVPASLPLARFGVWDHRSKEEVKTEPDMVTATCVELVTLLEGDIISISHPSYGAKCDDFPVPDDVPPHLVNSFTLIKVHGDSVARFERKRVGKDHVEGSCLHTHAAWIKAGLTLSKSPLDFNLSNESIVIEPQAGGDYLVLGRIAVTRAPVTSDSGDRLVGYPQFRAKLPCGRLLHTNHAVFLGESGDFSHHSLSENGSFHDIVSIREGSKIEVAIERRADVILDNHGTADDPFGKIPSQSLSMLLLSNDMEFDRYVALPGLESNWWWERAVSRIGRQRPPLLSPKGKSLVVGKGPTRTALVIGWFPPLVDSCGLLLLQNMVPVAYSQTLRFSGQSHNFHEIIIVEEGDELTVKEFDLDLSNGWQGSLEKMRNGIDMAGSVGGHLCVVFLA